jgi:tetratricopeptide (TPR) repeat protein
LLHETGRLAEGERVYRRAILACDNEPLLLYNLGVLLDDMGRKSAAMDAYEKALHEDPRFADCHYNLALLCKSLGRPKQALKHMAQYRRLVKPRG